MYTFINPFDNDDHGTDFNTVEAAIEYAEQIESRCGAILNQDNQPVTVLIGTQWITVH